jgi:hypothetical protein
MKTILSQYLTPGMLVVNLGIITSIERQEATQLVRVVIIEGKCLSAAFFWFNFDIPIMVC